MVETLPPTSYLPPIKRISFEDIDSLNTSIEYLRSIYNPEVRGSRRRKSTPASTDGGPAIHAMTPQPTTALNAVRQDSFERAYAIKWLTALISALDSEDRIPPSFHEQEKTICDAASLLAVCSGASAAGTVVRDFTFSYHPFRARHMGSPIPITVKLTDISLDNEDYGSVGAQTWGGACVLSEMIIEDPGLFGLSADQLEAHERNVFRVLELGAGTGLVSLTVGKLLQNMNLHGSRRVEIVATDYYPSVLKNLRSNIQANVPPTTSSQVTLLAHPLDWSCFGPDDTHDLPFDKPFDLVLGSDIIYEPEHAGWIRSCLTHLLRKPSSSTSNCTQCSFFHLVVPLRPTHTFESSTIETVFAADTGSHSLSLQVVAKDTFVCDTESGEEVEYAYFTIGWIERQY